MRAASLTIAFRVAPQRRVEETAYLIGKMVLPGGLSPGGESHETLVRVRLLHSALRWHLVSSKRFTHPTEVPINQQDLAITNALFGYMNLRSLRQLGVALSKDEVDSWMLLWRYAGHLLGIHDELLPRSLLDQSEFMMASMKHQCRPEKMNEGSKAILDAVADKLAEDSRGLFPQGSARRFLHQMTRFLSGNEYVTGMKLADEGDWYWGIVTIRLLGRLTSLIAHIPVLGEPLLYNLNMLPMQRFFNARHLKTAGHAARL